VHGVLRVRIEHGNLLLGEAALAQLPYRRLRFLYLGEGGGDEADMFLYNHRRSSCVLDTQYHGNMMPDRRAAPRQ
jgi:hypothetical protein